MAAPNEPDAPAVTGRGAVGTSTLARLLGPDLADRAMALGRRLRARLAGSGNAIQTRAGVEPLAFKSIHPHWIVGRGLCLYRSTDFASVPRNRRDAVVVHQLPVWSPFERTGHHCVWSGSTAMVWFWDADAVEIQPPVLGLDDDGLAPARVRTVPETLFYPRRADGLGIQECHEGFELQVWRDDVLRDSLWQPVRPDRARIEWFLGRQTFPDEIDGRQAAEPSPSRFAPDPWASPVAPRVWLLANERALVLAALALFAAIAGFQEARHWRIHFALGAAEAELARIEDELAPVLGARAELAALGRRSGRLAELLAHPSQALIMAKVDRALPEPTTEFRNWRYQRGELTLVLVDADFDTVAVVAALQREPLFTGVEPGQTQQDGRGIVLTIDPDPHPQRARAARAGGGDGASR